MPAAAPCKLRTCAKSGSRKYTFLSVPNLGRFVVASYLCKDDTANMSSSILTYSFAVWWLPTSVFRRSDDHDTGEPDDAAMFAAIWYALDLFLPASPMTLSAASRYVLYVRSVTIPP